MAIEAKTSAPGLAALRNWALLFGLWELVGRLRLVADGALPAPSLVLLRLWQDRGDYPAHLWATVQGSFWGFAIGSALAVLAALLFSLAPRLATVARGLNVTLFALPAIAISPLLTLMTSGLTPRIILAAIACYFPTMMVTLTGLSQSDRRLGDVIRAYGGSALARLRHAQLRGALPMIASGLKMGAPAAVLGSIMAEFGGGGRYGLGAYLIGSLGRAEPERLWGIGLVATALSGLAYALFALLERRVSHGSRAVTIPVSPPPAAAARGWQDMGLAVLSLLLPFALWWGILAASGAPAMVAKTPAGVFDFLFLAPKAGDNLAKLGAALGQTIPLAFLGMIAGLGFAFLLGLAGVLWPALVRALLPVALITQTMPLVALTPLLVLLLGRGTALILWVTISVTFFPAFVTLARGLAEVPAAALDIARAYGASRATTLWRVMIPQSLPYAFSAMRMAVPRALLGVMIAEWLATGTGLGNLLNQSRGYMDYGMIWSVACVSVLLSVLFYHLVVRVERRVLGRLGMSSSE